MNYALTALGITGIIILLVIERRLINGEVLYLAARRAVEQELTKEIILDAARDLFVQKGYQHVSMRQLANVLGYSHGAIYYHFKNKAELFYTLVRQDFSLLDQKLEETMAEEAMAQQTKLENVLLGFIEFGLVNQSHYEIMFLVKDSEVKSYLAEGPNESYEKFAQAIFILTDRKTTPAVIWSMFLSLHGFVSHYCKSGQTFKDVESLAKAHVQFILKSVQ
jgi:AcrR family transcriptional regulator